MTLDPRAPVMARVHYELAARLAADEPRTTPALGALLSATRWRHRVRVLKAGPGDRSVCPVIRVEPGVWMAYPVLGDPADAAELASAIDRSVALVVEGSGEDMTCLMPFLRRRMNEINMERMTRPWAPIEWRAPVPAARLATRLDLRGLIDLYDGYEHGARRAPTMRRELAAAIERSAVVVYEGESTRLEAAIVATTRTPRFFEWSMLTVRPTTRQRGYAWAVADRAIAFSNAAGLGFTYTIGPGNPMTFPPELGDADTVTVVNLFLPRRFRGEPRLWRLWLKANHRQARRPLEYERPEPMVPGRDIAGLRAGDAQT